MAAEFSQEAVLDFVTERGGRVRSGELTEHFRAAFPQEPGRRAAARDAFKSYVDNVAFVKAECGVKYVCLRKRFRRLAEEEQQTPGVGDGTETQPGQVFKRDNGARQEAAARSSPAAEQQVPPGSGYGSDSQVSGARRHAPRGGGTSSRGHEFVCVVEEAGGDGGGAGEMGNTGARLWGEKRSSRRSSRRERAGVAAAVPDISVTEASPLPAEGPVFNLPGPVAVPVPIPVPVPYLVPVQTGITGRAHAAAAGLRPTDSQAPTAEQIEAVTRRRNSTGSSRHEDEEEQSGSDSEDNGTPKGSRKHFIQVMMDSSPQVRRSMVLRQSIYLSSRGDSDSASLASSTLEEDGTSVTLDPLEHEWMMCASDGEWGSLQRLLAVEPGLVLRKDFITGFTCLHWAAKLGRPELIALIMNFAKQHSVPISVDVRSSAGYTPLHIAAMHNHMEVVKLLVGAYAADVEARDYSGRKACQYLTDSASVDIRDIIGVYEQSHSEDAGRTDRGPGRFSRVLQSNLKPLRLLHPSDRDSVDGAGPTREKPVRRKSSLSRMKPKLQRLRKRTSQIVHSTSFHMGEEEVVDGHVKSRPKTHFFGWDHRGHGTGQDE